MVASASTVKDVLAIMRHYVRPEEFRTMLTELARVQGNTSFRQTVVALQREYEREEKRREPGEVPSHRD